MKMKRRIFVAFPAFEASVTLVFAYLRMSITMGVTGFSLLLVAAVLYCKWHHAPTRQASPLDRRGRWPSVDNAAVQLALFRCAIVADGNYGSLPTTTDTPSRLASSTGEP